MKFIFALLCFIILCSCNNSNKTKQVEQQQKIDSLTSENQKLKEEKAQKETQKEAQKRQDEINTILNNIDNYLITKPHFDPPGMGGIINGSVTVENSLKVNVDKAIIEVRIIKDNGEPYTTNYYDVENIEPRDVKIIHFPNSSRGTSVKTRVVKIKCAALTQGQLLTVGSVADTTKQ